MKLGQLYYEFIQYNLKYRETKDQSFKDLMKIPHDIIKDRIKDYDHDVVNKLQAAYFELYRACKQDRKDAIDTWIDEINLIEEMNKRKQV